jgi:hypothetical protein
METTTRAIPADVAARAATRYVVELRVARLGPCHISTYSTASHGYAQIGWQRGGDRDMTTAQRAAWTHFNGPIPAGLTVDHECHVRPCVRREHLRLLTNPENARDNGQIRVNVGTGVFCGCGEEKVAAEGGKPYCRGCQNRRRRARRAQGSRN